MCIDDHEKVNGKHQNEMEGEYASLCLQFDNSTVHCLTCDYVSTLILY